MTEDHWSLVAEEPPEQKVCVICGAPALIVNTEGQFLCTVHADATVKEPPVGRGS
jgi:hypothetical protein